jgi:hypothetical protein
MKVASVTVSATTQGLTGRTTRPAVRPGLAVEGAFETAVARIFSRI